MLPGYFVHSISISHIFSFVALHSCCDKVSWHYSNHELINATAKTFHTVQNEFSLQNRGIPFFFIFARTMPQLQIQFVVLRAASYSKRWSQLICTAGAANIYTIQESRFPLKTVIFTSYHSVHTTSCRANYNFSSKITYNETKLPFGTTARHGIPTTD